MKVCIINPNYSTYVDQFYSENPHLQTESYDNQLKALEADGFGWNGVWAQPLATYGYETITIYPNVSFLQQAWSKENLGKIIQGDDIVTEQIRKHKTEIYFSADVSNYGSDFIKRKLSDQPIKFFLANVCSPYYQIENLKQFDLIFTCLRHQRILFEENGLMAAELQHAFNGQIAETVKKTVAPHSNNISFIGGFLKGKILHNEREKLITELINEFNLKLYSEIYYSGKLNDRIISLVKQVAYSSRKILNGLSIDDSVIRKIPVVGKSVEWKEIPRLNYNRFLKSHSLPPVYGIEMFKVLAESFATINIHAGIAQDEASNVRLFEATGSGACLVTDWKNNLGEFFEVGKEVLAYKSIEECKEIIHWLYANPVKRDEIAKAAQERVLRDHTFFNRAILFDNAIKRLKK
jgi:spore maturation protein CgeB